MTQHVEVTIENQDRYVVTFADLGRKETRTYKIIARSQADALRIARKADLN